jgi:pimeloyl-ACP methyl ester carboxylesterase
MERKTFRVVVVAIVAVLLGAGAIAVWSSGDAGARPSATRTQESRVRPMVFVHGFSGSGAQWETQALRFTSNGYRAEHIALHDYDSLFGTETRTQVFERLDARIASLLRATKADRVDLLGHSLGTSLMQAYLNSSPERAATVAHYVNLDGAPAAASPGGVPTLAIWGEGNTGRRIGGGATNLYFTRQTHVEVVTSPETFSEVYTFFTGKEPRTTDVVPDRDGRIKLAGRALLFPQNTGVVDGTLEIHEVNGATGRRLDGRPEATYPLRGDGSWGPFSAKANTNYEFAIVRDGGAATHHLYHEPFVRDDHWLRLLTSPVDAGIGALIERSDRHAAITIVRYMEWWGDQGVDNDRLEINGVNILNATNAPISKTLNALLVFDAGSDGTSNLGTPIPSISGLPFLTGVDAFVAGTSPPNDTISVASTPRRGGGRTELVNVPNWASSTDAITVHFNEYTD